MPETRLTPRAAAMRVLIELERRRDPARAVGAERYFKETVASLGIPAADVRLVATRAYTRVRASWDVADAIAYCGILIRDRHLEVKSAGLALVERFADRLTPADLRVLEGWLERFSGNWATVDQIAPHLLGPLLDRHPGLIPTVASWTRSRNLWLRRAAAVAFVIHARRGRHLDAAYEIAGRLLGDREDLIHKAVGWLLREAGKTDPARLSSFLLAHGPRIPRTTLRYAIERFPERARKRLLEATRA